MSNIVSLWLELIGTPERARKLRARIDGLASPPLDSSFGPEPPQCPTTVIFGAEVSRKLYSDPQYRPALDAWDTGAVSRGDIRRWCFWIEKGNYAGPIFYPSDAWRVYLRQMTIANVLQMESLRRSRNLPTSESRESISHERRLASRGTEGRKRRA